MIEGFLCASATPGGYAIDQAGNSNLARGEAIELFLAGNWISGHIAYSDGYIDPSQASRGNEQPQIVGAYYIAEDEVADNVMEASEESFPASDPPAWSTPHRRTGSLFNGAYFVADTDGSICGLCIGMRVRKKER